MIGRILSRVREWVSTDLREWLTYENALWVLIGFGIVAVIVLSIVDRRRARRAPARLRRDGEPAAEAEPDDEVERMMRRRLRASNLGINPYLFLVIVFALALAAGLGVMRLFHGMLIPGVITFLSVAYIVYNLMLEASYYRALRFEQKLVDGIELLMGALSSGENPAQAMSTVASLADDPVKAEFGQIASRLKMGLSIRRALGRMMERYDCEGVRLFVNTLVAKWPAGGDFVPVLTIVNGVIRERLRYRIRLQSQLSGARTAAIIVAASPYLMVMAFQWRNPEWLRTIFDHPYGPTLIFAAIGLQVVGFVLMRRMVKVKL